MYGTPNSTTFFSSVWTWMRLSSSLMSEGVRAPDQAQTLIEALEYHVERQPERLMVHLYDEGAEHALSYRAIWDGAMAYAARLVDAGLTPGQTVAIMLPTSREYLFSFYGTLLAGGIPVPLYPPVRLSTIEDHMTRHVSVLKSAGASVMVTIPEAKPLAWLLRAQVESLRAVMVPAEFTGSASGFAPVRGRSGHIGFLQYTSGSTGNPNAGGVLGVTKSKPCSNRKGRRKKVCLAKLKCVGRKGGRKKKCVARARCAGLKNRKRRRCRALVARGCERRVGQRLGRDEPARSEPARIRSSGRPGAGAAP